MKVSKLGLFGLVAGGMLLLGADARAVEVRFVTTGTFTETGTSTISSGNATVTFLGAGANEPTGTAVVDVPPQSQTSFGTFDTSGTPSSVTTFQSFNSGFVLDIFQFAPTEGELSFVGSLTGQLRYLNSQLVVQFDQPLVGAIGLVVYTIASADGGVPGQIFIAPPTTNQGQTTIAGQINFIPEPSSVVLIGMGAVAPLGLALRRRHKARAAA